MKNNTIMYEELIEKATKPSKVHVRGYKPYSVNYVQDPNFELNYQTSNRDWVADLTMIVALALFVGFIAWIAWAI